jgi:hypothetical protein
MDDSAPMEEVFRITPDGKYIYNNQEISKQDFDQLKAASSQRIQEMRPSMNKRVPLKDRAKSSFDDLSAEGSKYRKGGVTKKNAVGGSQSTCKMSTHQKYKKSSNW